LTSTTGAPGYYFFSVNGAYDPNITGTGHQPLGFDEQMTRFNQYCVKQSSIRVCAVGLTTSIARWGIVLYDAASGTSDPNRLVENGQLTMGVLNSNAGSNVHTQSLQLHCDVPRFFGAPWSSFRRNPSYLGTAAANPTEQAYFGIVLWGGFSASTMTITFDVTLSYDIEYFEPKRFVSS